jgi:hypothetical protein
MHLVTFGSKRNTTPPKLYTHFVRAFCDHLVFAKLRKASESTTLWRNDDDTDLSPPPRWRTEQRELLTRLYSSLHQTMMDRRCRFQPMKSMWKYECHMTRWLIAWVIHWLLVLCDTLMVRNTIRSVATTDSLRSLCPTVKRGQNRVLKKTPQQPITLHFSSGNTKKNVTTLCSNIVIPKFNVIHITYNCLIRTRLQVHFIAKYLITHCSYTFRPGHRLWSSSGSYKLHTLNDVCRVLWILYRCMQFEAPWRYP